VAFAPVNPGSRFRIEFVPATAEGEPRCIEHTRVAWLAERALLELPLAPSDLADARYRVDGGRGAGGDRLRWASVR
jgi:hypothetical protein